MFELLSSLRSQFSPYSSSIYVLSPPFHTHCHWNFLIDFLFFDSSRVNKTFRHSSRLKNVSFIETAGGLEFNRNSFLFRGKLKSLRWDSHFSQLDSLLTSGDEVGEALLLSSPSFPAVFIVFPLFCSKAKSFCRNEIFRYSSVCLVVITEHITVKYSATSTHERALWKLNFLLIWIIASLSRPALVPLQLSAANYPE